MTSKLTGGEASVAKKLRSLGFDVQSSTGGRNPPWAWDELILALDLYFSAGGALDDADPRAIELSGLLNELPIHPVRPDQERFRNPNGVALKLANFSALDPIYTGVGMSRGSKRDREVWDRFTNARAELHQLAAAIKAGVQQFPETPEEDEDSIQEGRLLYRRHRTRERDPRIVTKKKAAARARNGALRCEACGFDFERSYGQRGVNYIECHHLAPLAQSGPTTGPRLQNLALVCANCHRMIHRREPWLKLDELQALLQ